MNSIVRIVLNNLITTIYITMLGTRISHTAHCFKIVQQAASWKTSHAQKQTTQNTNQLLRQRRLNYKVQTEPHFSHCTLFWQYFRDLLVEKNSKPKHTYTKRNQMFKRYRKASQSPIPSWVTNQQVLIIFFCAFRNKGEGAPAISDLVQRENNGTGYWIVNMSDSHFGRPQYVIYCSQLRATPSADCNISHIAVGLSNYLIHTHLGGWLATSWYALMWLRDAVSEFVCQSLLGNVTAWCIESAVAQWLEHPTTYITEGRGLISHLGLGFFPSSHYI